jgi:CHAD domain-containing protein
MAALVLTYGKEISLLSYLGYFFLRFPGKLGDEETWPIEFLDTWDQRWNRSGKAWLQRDGETFLVSPPALFPLSESPRKDDGLWARRVWGRVQLSVRRLRFEDGEGNFLDGMVVRSRAGHYLSLRVTKAAYDQRIAQALLADGLEEFKPRGIETLTRLLHPAFLPPTPFEPLEASSSAQVYLLQRATDEFRVARQYEKGIQLDIDTECLHQYRVQLRKVRSLLSQGRMWKAQESWTEFKLLFKDLMQQTNELRDLDVLLLEVPHLLERLPSSEAQKLESWKKLLETRRETAQKKLKTWLSSKVYVQKIQKIDWEVLKSGGETWSTQGLAQKALTRISKKLNQLLRSHTPRDEDLHAVRIETKKLRYVLEAFGSLFPEKSVSRLLKILKQTQLDLGRFQDSSLKLQRLHHEAQDSAQVDPFAYGFLVGVLWAEHAFEKKRAERAVKRLRRADFRQELGRLRNGGPDAS